MNPSWSFLLTKRLFFTGRALTKTGMGRIVEGATRNQKYVPRPALALALVCSNPRPVLLCSSSRFDAILGGAEEILGDLGVRQAMAKMPKDVRL